MENTQCVFSLSWAILPRQRANNSLSEAAAGAVGVQMCCCCALHWQLTSFAVMTAAGMAQSAWDKALVGMESTKSTALQPAHGAALCRVAACIPHQSCLPQGGFTLCSFTLFLVFHEHLEHWFGREYDLKSGVKCLIQPTNIHMYKSTP